MHQNSSQFLAFGLIWLLLDSYSRRQTHFQTRQNWTDFGVFCLNLTLSRREIVCCLNLFNPSNGTRIFVRQDYMCPNKLWIERSKKQHAHQFQKHLDGLAELSFQTYNFLRLNFLFFFHLLFFSNCFVLSWVPNTWPRCGSASSF